MNYSISFFGSVSSTFTFKFDFEAFKVSRTTLYPPVAFSPDEISKKTSSPVLNSGSLKTKYPLSAFNSSTALRTFSGRRLRSPTISYSSGSSSSGVSTSGIFVSGFLVSGVSLQVFPGPHPGKIRIRAISATKNNNRFFHRYYPLKFSICRMPAITFFLIIINDYKPYLFQYHENNQGKI